jgi:alpha-galactosidase
MLVVGLVGWGPQLHPSRLSPDEQYTHISLWSLLASPLLIGCDMTRMDEFTYSLLTNDEVLDINQDTLGKQAKRSLQLGSMEIWSKELEDGSLAVGLSTGDFLMLLLLQSGATLGLRVTISSGMYGNRKILALFRRNMKPGYLHME